MKKDNFLLISVASLQQASLPLNSIKNTGQIKKTHNQPTNKKPHLRAWARLNAQSRRYEAVLEIHPRQYSMVWIAWFIKTSAKLS